MLDDLMTLKIIKRNKDNNNTFLSHIMSMIGCYSKANLEKLPQVRLWLIEK